MVKMSRHRARKKQQKSEGFCLPSGWQLTSMKKRITRSGACSTMPSGKYILFNSCSLFLFFVLCLFGSSFSR
jgi:hypothetical protein